MIDIGTVAVASRMGGEWRKVKNIKLTGTAAGYRLGGR